MWFLWSVITFLIIIFSTGQLIAYLVCFVRYPELMQNMQDRNKKMIIGGIVLHAVINLVWVVMIGAIPAISKHYLPIIITSIIALFFSIDGVKNDQNLYKNFKILTGAADREKIIEAINKFVDGVAVDKKVVDGNKFINNDNSIYSNLEEKKKIESYIRGDENLNLSYEKKINLQKMFNKNFNDVLATQETIINRKKCITYSFSPLSDSYNETGGFMYLSQIGVKNPRYFALEVSGSGVWVLCEWVFDKNRKIRHDNYGVLINGIRDIMGEVSSYDRYINKLKSILK